VVNDSTSEVIEFDPAAHILLRFGGPKYLDHPTDLALDQAGNVFVSDSNHSRIVKFDPSGRVARAVGSPGSEPGQMKTPHSIAADASGHVYVADGGNARIQVFDNNLNLVAIYDTVGSPWAVCITQGAHQYLYTSSNPDQTDVTRGRTSGEILKLELDGTIVGRVGGTENAVGSMFGNRWTTAAFWTPHLMQCHDENEILSTTLYDWVHIIRMQP